MIATGNIKIISDNNNINETLSNLSDKVDEEIERATAREDSIVQNLINELTSIKNNAEKNLLDTEKKIFDNVNIQQQTASSKYNHLWKNIVFKDNYFINLNGTFTYSNSQLVKATEEYYTCNNSEMLNIFLWLKPSYDIFVAFYDEDKNFISSYTSDKDKFILHNISIPRKAKYFRASCFFPSNNSIKTDDVVYTLTGASIYEMLMGENYRTNGNISYNEYDVVKSHPVIWADGTEGVFTSTDWDESNKMFLGYQVTYGTTLKVVQPPCVVENFKIKSINKKYIA